jgi:hypothetical protein
MLAARSWVRLAALTGALVSPVHPSAADESPLVVKWEREACYGWCPVYSVEVREDGRVSYAGRRNVRVVGKATKRLSARKMEELRRALADARLDAAAPHCCDCRDRTDADTVTITIRAGDAERRIRDYHGCAATPAPIRDLENRLDAIVATEPWVGTREEIMKTIRAQHHGVLVR